LPLSRFTGHFLQNWRDIIFLDFFSMLIYNYIKEMIL